ncbi:Steryl ester hydrolase 2 [Hyphodiscus hymeniophilus]|uniref:Steryl ester hydrolase 2 n=1 Tax=Hyphodiscus hymeniophilus TaxID=353542 RepID=A0A9P7AVV4_9HELO|nr:Steryl ester hydrolase 2 [Hyphodiscus hymeniophilus]
MGDITDQRSPSNASALSNSNSSTTVSPLTVMKYAHQAEKLSHIKPDPLSDGSGTALEAHFVTPQDPVIKTADGNRLPGVPLAEAEKLNELKAEIEGGASNAIEDVAHEQQINGDGPHKNASRPVSPQDKATIQRSGEGSLRRAMPPSRTNPLFPPLPLYGPSSISRDLQCYMFRITSFFLSLTFLGIIILGSAFTSIPLMFNHIGLRLTGRNPDARRPFYEEEQRRKKQRMEAARTWKKQSSRRNSTAKMDEDNEDEAAQGEFIPTEGGSDPLICDAGYYARRVGLDVEEFKVQTEDGFIITLWHVYNPLEFTPMSESERAARGPDIFTGEGPSRNSEKPSRKPKFPVLMIHGLLQSAGAYCTNDDDSLAFYLCKSGYDVWLGNNRSGFNPEHTLLSYSDPRMWAWNIRQMGVMDLPALTSRVLSETGFEKIGLIAHSQGTTQTLVALAKEQRPALGEKLTVFCALAPAAYAGPLIGKAYFKFMRVISPAFFRIIFGIHAFIPFMMTMHRMLPGRLYGAMGYRVFSFLFNWSDDRWERDIRDRMFQFAPVYVSAESMRWWLGRECFAKQKCILATREEGHLEDAEDEMEEYYHHTQSSSREAIPDESRRMSVEAKKKGQRKPKGSTAWYNEQVPPFALWVCGADDLVDGRKLLKRFEGGREPHVRIVHQRVIEGYEHLDVIWAMDSIEKVGSQIKEVLWKTCNVRDKVRVPRGCEDVQAWVDPKADGSEVTAKEKPTDEEDDGEQSSSGSEERAE